MICLELTLYLRAGSKLFKWYWRLTEHLTLIFSLKFIAGEEASMFAPFGIFWHPLPARLKLIGWVGTRMDEGWGLTVWPVNSHPSVWTLVAGSVLVAALLPWSESGPFYSRQMLGRWWGPRYVRPPAPFLLFMWICVWTDAFLPCAPVCFHWTDSKPEFCSGRYWCFACWRHAH